MKAVLTFPLTVQQAQDPVMKRSLEAGVAMALGLESNKVSIASFGRHTRQLIAASAFDCSTAVSFGGMPGATDVTASNGACNGFGCYSYSYTGTAGGASYDISTSGCASSASVCSDFATTADSGAAQIGATVSGWSCAVTAAATSTDATAAPTASPLTCQISYYSGTRDLAQGMECGTTSAPYNDAQGTCTTEGHSCLTGKFEGGVNAAYGCYPNGHIEAAKEAVVAACNLDSVCAEYNPDGPKNGFDECTTDSCNSCDNAVNGAGALAPSLALLAVTLLAIASGLL